jgi:hypothetical protein
MNRKARDRGAPPAPGHRELLRAVLRAERGLRRYRPAPRPWTGDPPPAPKHADEVLAALAGTYKPGDAIGLQQIVDTIAIDWDQARAVRDWAEQTGAWPYLRPSGMRPAGRPDPGPGSSRRRKPGGGP